MVPASVGYKNFDFVGIQEANRIDNLKNATKQSLSKLTMVHSYSPPINRGHKCKWPIFMTLLNIL